MKVDQTNLALGLPQGHEKLVKGGVPSVLPVILIGGQCRRFQSQQLLCSQLERSSHPHGSEGWPSASGILVGDVRSGGPLAFVGPRPVVNVAQELRRFDDHLGNVLLQ